MNTRFPLLFATLGMLLLAPWAHAQFEIKGDVRNVLDHRRAGGFATVSAGGVVTAITVRGDKNSTQHEASVSKVSEDMIFYMQQRGIPADEARALLTEAFLIEVVDRIAHEGAREVVRAWLTDRL